MKRTIQTCFIPRKAVLLGIFLLLVLTVQRTEGTCTFPSDLSGSWQSSRWGVMDFTSSSLVDVYNLADLGNIEFQCAVSSGTTYVLRSTSSVTVLGNTVDVVACLDLRKVSSTKYYYYHGTTEKSFVSADTEPVVLQVPSSASTISAACDITSFTTGTNHMLIAQGAEISAAIQCPDPMLATFDNVTIDNGSGAQCGGVGYIHMCNNRQNITIDYSVCAESIFYSSEGNLECVYYSSSGSTYYVNVFNFDSTVDDSSTFRFSCVAIAYGSGSEYVYATQYPMACDSSQTSTSVPSSPYQGGTLQLVSNLTCIPTTAAASSGGSSIMIIIIIIILLLIILILLALCIYHFYYRRRWSAFKRKITCAENKTRTAKNAKVDPVDQPEPEKPKDDVKPKYDVETKHESTDVTLENDDHEMVTFKTPKERPLSGLPPTSPAALSADNEFMRRRLQLQSSQSSRSVATPSLLQPDLSDSGNTAAATITTTTSLSTETDNTNNDNTIQTQTEGAQTTDAPRLPPLETHDPHLDVPGTPTQDQLYV